MWSKLKDLMESWLAFFQAPKLGFTLGEGNFLNELSNLKDNWQEIQAKLLSKEFSRFNNKYKSYIVSSMLYQAIGDGATDSVHFLLTHKKLAHHADIHMENLPYLTALSKACALGNLDLVRYFLTSPELREKADIERGGHHPLSYACEAGHLEVVRYLLTSPEIIQAGGKHADIDARNGHALIQACAHGHLEIVKYLLTSPEIVEAGGKHANIHDDQALLLATIHNQLEVVKYLLALQPQDTTRALVQALEKNYTQIIEYLILDYRMARPVELEDYLLQYPEVLQMFERSELQTRLQQDLEGKPEKKKTTKL